MKAQIKPILATLTASATLALGAPADAAVVVYEDSFDGDGLATNTGIGGGIITRSIAGGSNFVDDGNLSPTVLDNGGDRSVASSVNSFLLTNGFTLTIQFEGGTNSLVETFMMSKSQYATDTNLESSVVPTNWAGEGGNGRYGIGVASRVNTNPGSEFGLNFNDGSQAAGAVHQLVTSTTDQFAAGLNTVVLTVTPDDQFSYSVNGAPAVTGEIDADGTIDLSQPLYFNVWSQSSAQLAYVKIEAIPEPSSLAILGLGGLLIGARRRRK